jgi:hypothetical protein
MSLLRTDGFDRLVAAAADRARMCAFAGECAKIALTLDGHLPYAVAEKALTAPERLVLEAAIGAGAGLGPPGEAGETLVLTPTGRMRIVADGSVPDDSHLLGVIDWRGSRPAGLAGAVAGALRHVRDALRSVRDWLAALPAAEVSRRLAGIRYAVEHMAPVLLYVGDRVYSNLNRFSNLPGKSLEYGAPGCLLTRLAHTPVAEWAIEDAAFVEGAHVLLLSGPPVRIEEFNGVQLVPDELAAFLAAQMGRYGHTPPVRGNEPVAEWLERLAAECAAARARAADAGALFCREINGINLHKREFVLRPGASHRDVPHELIEFLDQVGPRGWANQPDTTVDDLAGELARRLTASPATPGFASAFEGFLHEFLRIAAEALASDVSMSRGPRDLRQLRADAHRSPMSLTTGSFFCCVAARASFARLLGDQAELARTLSAYSARMRFNSWHYLPHTLARAGDPARPDWFFAPTMPDVTEWSDQHHTGHVAFGVRYAIRVPLGIEFDGAYRPGMYDLRFMRAAEPRFGRADLRAAIAVGQVLAAIYQAMSAYPYVVTNFSTEWYRRHHG